MDKCIVCNGTGKVLCKECNGKGKVACSTCGGSGREIKICPTCTKGVVPDPRSLDDDATLQCPNCHGEWQKDVGACKECNGTGYASCHECEESGNIVCSVCQGVGELDVAALCKQLIDISSYYIKINVDKITADIVQVIQDAADKGVGLAAFVMSSLCSDGLEIDGEVVVEENQDKAMAYLRKGAESGDRIAQGAYGISLLTDDDEGKRASGLPWLVKASEKGNIESLYLLAIDGYIYGNYGYDRDLVKSLECFKAILNAKDKDSWHQGYIISAEGYVKFLPGIINNDTEEMLALADWMRKNDNYENRGSSDEEYDYQYWILEAAKAGNVAAIRTIAREYWKNNEKDRAIEWYEKGVEQGDGHSMTQLGSILRKGLGIPKNLPRAFILLCQAAEKGRPVAVRRLAHMYRDGEYVAANRKSANELYTRAAKSGDGWSLYEIGKCYLKGIELRKDEAEAKRLLTLAAEKDVEEAKTLLKEIDPSVASKDKGPSGIVVGQPDNQPLPKFLKKDFERAIAGKPALTTKVKKDKTAKPSGTSIKKRWKFVVLGLLFGYLGAHLAYAKRWILFLLLWGSLIGFFSNIGINDKSEEGPDPEPITESQPAKSKGGNDAIAVPCFLVFVALWIGGTLFIKKDGKGDRM